MKHQIASVVLLSLSASLTACSSGPEPGPVPTGDGDLRYLIPADPAVVTSADLLSRALDAEERTQEFHLAEGIYWQAMRSSDDAVDPDLYGSGGDSLLFTGIHLAARVYKYSVTRSPSDLRLVADAVRGTYILTHISGTPGVLARCAFPTDRAAEWDFPHAWQGRIANGFIYESPTNISDPLVGGAALPRMTFYTRVTRDQLSGLLYGLSVLWSTLEPEFSATPETRTEIRKLRHITANIVEAVWANLRRNDFRILDHTGRNDTSADSLSDDLLMLQLLSIYRRVVSPDRAMRVEEKYQDLFDTLRFPGFWAADLFNRFSNGDQYYAWNLRFCRAFSVWLLADPKDKGVVAEYIDDLLFKHVRNHRNAFFSMTYAAVASGAHDFEAGNDAVMSLKSWSLRPTRGWCSPVALGWTPGDEQPGYLSRALTYVVRVLGLDDDDVLWPHLKEPTTYFIWQKDPWDNGITFPHGSFDGVGLDYSIVYWMGRHYGFLR